MEENEEKYDDSNTSDDVDKYEKSADTAKL